MENPGAVNSSSPEIRRGESSPGCAFLPGLFGGVWEWVSEHIDHCLQTKTKSKSLQVNSCSLMASVQFFPVPITHKLDMQVNSNTKYVVTSIVMFLLGFILQLLLNYWMFLPLFPTAVGGSSLPTMIDGSFSHRWLLLISYSRHVYMRFYYERFLLCDFIMQLLQEARTRSINTFVIKLYVDFQINVLKCSLSERKIQCFRQKEAAREL